MKSVDRELRTWLINKIDNEYKGEVSLVIARKAQAFEYFIPACEHGNNLATTFIIGEMGYDLYPMSWNRLEGIASLDEGMTFSLDDTEVIYAKSEADIERFEKIKERLVYNLSNKEYTYKRALIKINSAMDLYKTMMFEKSFGKVRKAAGAIVQNLYEAIAMFNGAYTTKDFGSEERLSQIKGFEQLPINFEKNYKLLTIKNDINSLNSVVYDLINETRNFFKTFKQENEIVKFDYEQLARWYEEMREVFSNIEQACKNKKHIECFSWGCYLQIELDILSDEAGLKNIDILGEYNHEFLKDFEEVVKEAEDYIVEVIRRNGILLRKYSNIEEFLDSQNT